MEVKGKFIKLQNLFGGYFYPYWKEDYLWQDKEADYKAVVRFFKVNNPHQTVEQATGELKALLRLDLEDDKLDDLFDNYFILGLRPQGYNLSNCQWLEEVLKVLEEPMEKTKQEFIPEFIG